MLLDTVEDLLATNWKAAHSGAEILLAATADRRMASNGTSVP